MPTKSKTWAAASWVKTPARLWDYNSKTVAAHDIVSLFKRRERARRECELITHGTPLTDTRLHEERQRFRKAQPLHRPRRKLLTGIAGLLTEGRMPVRTRKAGDPERAAHQRRASGPFPSLPRASRATAKVSPHCSGCRRYRRPAVFLPPTNRSARQVKAKQHPIPAGCYDAT